MEQENLKNKELHVYGLHGDKSPLSDGQGMDGQCGSTTTDYPKKSRINHTRHSEGRQLRGIHKHVNPLCHSEERSDVRIHRQHLPTYHPEAGTAVRVHNKDISHVDSYGTNVPQNDRSELGRSMVEMLGVLAIIGVLSVAGIAGYKMAMEKITENKISNLFARVYTGMQASLMNPNSALHCCSSPVSADDWYNRCIQKSGHWDKDQSDEICTFLNKDECYYWTEQDKNHYYLTKDHTTQWRYETIMGIDATNHYNYAAITFQFRSDKVSPIMCQNILNAIINNQTYQKKLDKLGYTRTHDYTKTNPSAEKVKDVCSRTQYGSGFTLYFKHDSATNCIEEIIE